MGIQLTPHFNSDEWRSHKMGVDYPLDRVDTEDPQGRTWRETRLQPQADMLEVIRGEAGCGIVHTPNGGYRPKEQQQAIVDASPDAVAAGEVSGADTSQHPKGRASDIYAPAMSAADLHALILRLFRAGALPQLGGLGLYPTFVHVDVRSRPGAIEDQPASGHLAQWGGARSSNDAA